MGLRAARLGAGEPTPSDGVTTKPDHDNHERPHRHGEETVGIVRDAGTLLKAWASMKSFRPKDGSGEPPPPGRNGEADFRKTKRSNETHASTTDPDARLFRKGDGQESRLAYLGHAVMENRNGLVVAAEATLATGTAEREAAARFERAVARRRHARRRQELRRRGLRRGLEGARDRAARGDQRDDEQERQCPQDRRPERRRRKPALCDQPEIAQTDRGVLRLGQDGGWAGAGQGARPRQSPRRLRLRHGRVRHRAPPQAPGSDGRSVSGAVKMEGKMIHCRGTFLTINQSQPKNLTPAHLLAETQ